MSVTDLMLDLETLGTRPGCAVLSIGAVAFSPFGGPIQRFIINIDLEDCQEYGLAIDTKTLEWWIKPERRDALAAWLSATKVSLPSALGMFNHHILEWFGERGPVQIWSHGASFDLPIIQAAYHAAGVDDRINADYRRLRDTRTLFALAWPESGKPPGFKNGHVAVEDAANQVNAVVAAYRQLGIKPAHNIAAED